MVKFETSIGYAKYATSAEATKVADALGISGYHSHAGKAGISTPNVGDRYFEPGVRKDHKNLDAALAERGMKPTIANPGGNRDVTNEAGNLNSEKLGLSTAATREEKDLPTFFSEPFKDGKGADISDGGDPEENDDLLNLDETGIQNVDDMDDIDIL